MQSPNFLTDRLAEGMHHIGETATIAIFHLLPAAVALIGLNKILSGGSQDHTPHTIDGHLNER